MQLTQVVQKMVSNHMDSGKCGLLLRSKVGQIFTLNLVDIYFFD